MAWWTLKNQMSGGAELVIEMVKDDKRLFINEGYDWGEMMNHRPLTYKTQMVLISSRLIAITGKVEAMKIKALHPSILQMT